MVAVAEQWNSEFDFDFASPRARSTRAPRAAARPARAVRSRARRSLAGDRARACETRCVAQCRDGDGGGRMTRAGVAPAPRALADTRRATMAKTIVGALAPLVARARARERRRRGRGRNRRSRRRGARRRRRRQGELRRRARRLGQARVDSAKFFVFGVGAGEVVAGFDAIVGGDGTTPPMRVGGARRAVVPAALAYGDRGAGCDKTGNACSIPPGADLEFTVELLEVK